MTEFAGINKPCSDCETLLKGTRTVPHEYLMRVLKTEPEEIYRCLLCDTHLRNSASGEPAWQVQRPEEK